MINKKNKGFGKFEVLTLIVLLFGIFAYLMYVLLGGVDKQKFTIMKENAVRLSNTVGTNISSFHNSDVVYLEEVIEEGFLKKIKSPFSSGDCDLLESKVEMVNDKFLVTLKCDDYLIDKASINSLNNINIYKVGEWELNKKSNFEEKKLYNCIKDEKEIYPKYKEENLFISHFNKDNNTNFYSINEIQNCTVVDKMFYRDKQLVE